MKGKVKQVSDEEANMVCEKVMGNDAEITIGGEEGKRE